MPELAHHDEEGERCRICGAVAAGPCARCKAPVCGDCCVLTEGGVQVWAVCTRCERGGAASLSRAWLGLGGWLVAILVVLAGAVLALAYVTGR